MHMSLKEREKKTSNCASDLCCVCCRMALVTVALIRRFRFRNSSNTRTKLFGIPRLASQSTKTPIYLKGNRKDSLHQQPSMIATQLNFNLWLWFIKQISLSVWVTCFINLLQSTRHLIRAESQQRSLYLLTFNSPKLDDFWWAVRESCLVYRVFLSRFTLTNTSFLLRKCEDNDHNGL